MKSQNQIEQDIKRTRGKADLTKSEVAEKADVNTRVLNEEKQRNQ